MLPGLGLDSAKKKVDAALLLENGTFKTKTFANTPHDFAQLLQCLDSLGAQKTRACMEATGTYHETLATILFDNRHTVCVVNPQRVKCVGASEGIRTKNDQVDASARPYSPDPGSQSLWKSGDYAPWGDAGMLF